MFLPKQKVEYNWYLYPSTGSGKDIVAKPSESKVKLDQTITGITFNLVTAIYQLILSKSLLVFPLYGKMVVTYF